MPWKEVCKGDDWLSESCKRRRGSPWDTMPSAEVQRIYGQCADIIQTQWARVPHQWTKTLSGGDLWVIAHAKEANGVAVSEESKSAKNETDTFQMLGALEADCSR